VGIKFLQINSLQAYSKAGAEAGMPPTVVGSALATEQEWEDALLAVGSLKAVQGVTLAAELGGTVVEIGVENGAAVEKGSLLVRLDIPVIAGGKHHLPG
jgi:membrane fusion protein, multidrug efflux system